MKFKLLFLIPALLFSSLIVDAQPPKKVVRKAAIKGPAKAPIRVNPNGKIKASGPLLPGRVKGAINSGGKGGIKMK
jgi:hypothetical protein